MGSEATRREERQREELLDLLLTRWQEAFERRDDDVKVLLDIAA